MSIPPPDFSFTTSVERPERLLDWCDKYVDHPAAGPIFWKALFEEWAGFDRINQIAFGFYMEMFDDWPFAKVMAKLPESVIVYCGMPNGEPPRHCWTLDINVAKNFAAGHRGTVAGDPVVWRAEICPQWDAALYITERNEEELVLREVPEKYERIEC
ncbi:MAG: hypothetical protein AAF674_15665 [Pseudomonadota bacterium]